MKRLLTYGLLLLTILASHFVVSACQKDLPETTEVMVTFTTRAFVKEEGGTTDAIAPEKMKDLRVIVFDGDNVVVGNDVREDINETSVVFSYATLVSDGETFKFLAIANEKSAGLAEVLADIGVGSKITNAQIDTWKTLTISNNLNPTADAPLLQSKFWTWTSQKDAPDPNATLDYAASKISVQFKNETNAVQSLTDIKIAGIGSATEAYLFAQADNDFANKQNPPSDISFEDVENLLPGTFSTIQNYYSNPLNKISSPKLTAKWNGEVRELSLSKDQNGNEIDLTSLGRNEYLQILVTLTGEGPKVTYTIHSWEDTPTNIGDEAHTIGVETPTTPGNGYNTEDWTAGNDIEIGGEGNLEGPSFIPEGTTAIWWLDGLDYDNSYNRLKDIAGFPTNEIDEGYQIIVKFGAPDYLITEKKPPYDVQIWFTLANSDIVLTEKVTKQIVCEEGYYVTVPFTYSSTAYGVTLDVLKNNGIVLCSQGDNNVWVTGIAVVH